MDYRKLFKTKRLKKQGTDELMEVAFHEAGHALIDLLYGLIPPEATIVPNHKTKTAGSVERAVQVVTILPSGEIITDRFDDIKEYFDFVYEIEISIEETLEYHVIDQLAGIIAGAMYSGRYNWIGAKTDHETMMAYFTHFGYYDVPPLQPYWDKTFKLLKENDNLLNELANILYTKKTLNKDDFEVFKCKMISKGYVPLINR